MTTEQLRGVHIGSQGILNKMLRWGWCDSLGRPKEWYQHQRPNHDAQFEEPRERKAGPKKFTKEKQ
jgi:hypothetical protein